jgi:hypothetical protein
MSLKKMGSKLARGVRQVKSQQGKSERPEAEKPHALPASVKTDLPAKKSDPAGTPAETRLAQKAAQSGRNLHPLRVWPD